jgi:hypothetical protein
MWEEEEELAGLEKEVPTGGKKENESETRET